MIRPFLATLVHGIAGAVATFSSDIVIVSSSNFLFAAHRFTGRPCIGDFSDCRTLYRWREFRHMLAQHKIKHAFWTFLDCIHFLFQEMYSSRKYAANILVSPVDKRVFDWIGNSRRNFCIANGIQIPGPYNDPKKKRQIVFSGAMNFPPNVEGALWFLDHVLPLVLEELPDVIIVIAGAMPDPRLLSRAGNNIIVPGFVSDLNRILAESALYVAPLVSGSGFKNKVVEALVNGTYVIGTTFAVEFLEPGIRRLIIARDNPAEMANAICDFLKHPDAHADKLQQLVKIVRRDFSWSARTKELIALGELVRVFGTTKSAVGRSTL